MPRPIFTCKQAAHQSLIKYKNSKQVQGVFERKFSKQDYLAHLQTRVSPVELETLSAKLRDSMSYVLVKYGHRMEAYICEFPDGAYRQIGSFPLADSVFSEIKLLEQNGQLQVNPKTTLSALPLKKWLAATKAPMLDLCCTSCFTIHELLDLHVLDCLCCLGACNFNCLDKFTISWN